MHQRLTLLVGIMAVVNLALSVALVRPSASSGVAIGTAVPVTLVAVGSLFPTACRRVGLAFSRRFPRGAVAGALAGCHLAFDPRLHRRATAAHVAIGRASVRVQHGDLFRVSSCSLSDRTGRREYLRHLTKLSNRSARPVKSFGTATAFTSTGDNRVMLLSISPR